MHFRPSSLSPKGSSVVCLSEVPGKWPNRKSLNKKKHHQEKLATFGTPNGSDFVRKIIFPTAFFCGSIWIHVKNLGEFLSILPQMDSSDVFQCMLSAKRGANHFSAHGGIRLVVPILKESLIWLQCRWGFPWGYPNSWMVYKGKSHLEMGDF